MGNFKFEIIFIVLLIALPSCKKFEIKGFLTTYEIVDHRFEQSMEYNNRNGYTEIDIAQNNYDIFAMSDSHVGETENLEKFFKNAKNQKSTAVVMLGDLTTGNEDDYNEWVEHLTWSYKLINPVNKKHFSTKHIAIDSDTCGRLPDDDFKYFLLNNSYITFLYTLELSFNEILSLVTQAKDLLDD